MEVPENWIPDGKFDGAELFDQVVSREGVVSYAHNGKWLGLVRDRKAYYRTEYFLKGNVSSGITPIWCWITPSEFCANQSEAQSLIEKYVQNGEIPKKNESKQV